MEITRDIAIEDLVTLVPASVTILRKHNLVCIICGEPIWGSLDDLATSKNIPEEELQQIIIEIHQSR